MLHTEKPKPDKSFKLPGTSLPDTFLVVCVQLKAEDILGAWSNFEDWWQSFPWYVNNSYTFSRRWCFHLENKLGVIKMKC